MTTPAVVSNRIPRSAGAVQRYHTVAANCPNDSPASSVAPRLLPSMPPSGPSITAPSAKSSFAGRSVDDHPSVTGTDRPKPVERRVPLLTRTR